MARADGSAPSRSAPNFQDKDAVQILSSLPCSQCCSSKVEELGRNESPACQGKEQTVSISSNVRVCSSAGHLQKHSPCNVVEDEIAASPSKLRHTTKQETSAS
eukprot:757949-Hanusia_phi.AAC.1